VIVGKISTRGTGGEDNKNIKNKEETYQSIQCDILVSWNVYNMSLSN
jgi:hypothetical protein